MLPKTKIIRFSLLGLAGIGLIAGIILLVDYLSYKTIAFELSDTTASAAIYNSDPDGDSPTVIKTISKSEDVRLKPGTYYVVPSGDTVLDGPIKTVITGDTKKVSIVPYRTAEYLATAFSGELPAIQKLIKTKYANVINAYDIGAGTFYQYGDWYATTLRNVNPSGSEGVDAYGIVCKKVDGSWTIAAPPALIFSYNDHKDIPADVLHAINRAVNSL